MNTERDKFLTGEMGECWHEWQSVKCKQINVPSGVISCDVCGKEDQLQTGWDKLFHNNFSTWQGFGKLWEWAQEQEWVEKFWWHEWTFDDLDKMPIRDMSPASIINPDRFANAVYEFLKALGQEEVSDG